MTGNVAQVFLSDAEWQGALGALARAVRDDGCWPRSAATHVAHRMATEAMRGVIRALQHPEIVRRSH
jgi:hypothetical protein